MRRRRLRGLQQQPQQSHEHHDDESPGDFDDLLVIDHHVDDVRRHDSTTAASTACNHITASPGQGQGAAGTITGTVTITNTGTTPCTADGYPMIALFSGSGAPLTVTIVNGLSVSLSPAANAPPSPVTVAPSSTAQFAYQYSDVPVGAQTSCPAPSRPP